jgi:hypothetical protein
MSIFAQPYLATDPGYYVAQSDSGSSPTLIIVIVIVAVLVILALVGGARQTVVVVENPGRSLGNLLGLLMIAVAVGIIFFMVVGRGSGSA